MLCMKLTKFIRTYKTVMMYSMKKTAYHLDLAYDGIITSGKLKIIKTMFVLLSIRIKTENNYTNELKINNIFTSYHFFCERRSYLPSSQDVRGYTQLRRDRRHFSSDQITNAYYKSYKQTDSENK